MKAAAAANWELHKNFPSSQLDQPTAGAQANKTRPASTPTAIAETPAEIHDTPFPSPSNLHARHTPPEHPTSTRL